MGQVGLLLLGQVGLKANLPHLQLFIINLIDGLDYIIIELEICILS